MLPTVATDAGRTPINTFFPHVVVLVIVIAFLLCHIPTLADGRWVLLRSGRCWLGVFSPDHGGVTHDARVQVVEPNSQMKLSGACSCAYDALRASEDGRTKITLFSGRDRAAESPKLTCISWHFSADDHALT